MSDGRRFKETRAKLAALGFRPSKKRGQNFLVDPNLCAAIVAAVPDLEGSVVLEVGSGTGMLTRALARHARVVAVEIDSRLVEFLTGEMRGWGEERANVRLVAGDVLEHGSLAGACARALAELGAEERGWLCVSNLPYSVAGPFLAGLATHPTPPRDGVVLAQLEMAHRVLARPGSPDYGTLSVLIGLAFAARLLRKVPAAVFRPRPKVESALVHLGPAQPWTREPAADRAAFGRFLQGVFAGRRKVLRNALGKVWEGSVEERFERGGLPAEWLRLRSEQLGPGELWRVFRDRG